MKYGLLTGFFSPYANYGDFAQSIALEYLYECMGIPKETLYHITVDELADYDGEELLLPFNYFYSLLLDCETGKYTTSSKIKPIFIAVTLADNNYGRFKGNILTEEALGIFKANQPIGCRDEYTRKLLESNGISAYLQGCLTNILPKREDDGKAEKNILVDCPIEVLSAMPESFLKDAEIMQNSFYVGDMSKEELWADVKAHYAYFRENACRMISSRYHAVTPCYAMGIPSIFIRRKYDMQADDVRLDTLNPAIPLYESDSYESIEWAVKFEDFSEMKEKMIRLASSKIRGDVETDLIVEVRRYFEKRIGEFEKRRGKRENRYRSVLREYVKANFPYPNKGRYVIWGAKPTFCMNGHVSIVDYIQEENPKLVFEGWVDTYKEGFLANKPIIKPKQLRAEEGLFVVIASENGLQAALENMKEAGIDENHFIICVNRMIFQEDLEERRNEFK